jgi:nitroreductase
MTVSEIIRKRKSIRNYKRGAEVSDEALKIMLDAAMLAPSACNMRPWKFIVVRDREILNKITEIHPYTAMLKTACAAILVLADLNIHNGVSEGAFPQDCGAASENILLQAAELGIGTCWCAVYPKENTVAEIKKLFDLPENIIPFNVIAVGVPNEEFGGRGFYEEEKVKWL